MNIKYDSSVVDDNIKILNESLTTLNSDFADTLMNDFSAFTELGLFSNQLSDIKKLVDELVKGHESFVSLLEQHKNDWVNQTEDGGALINQYVGASVGSYSGGSSGGHASSSYGSSSHTNPINSGISVSTADVNGVVSKFDSTTLPILLKKIYDGKGNESIGNLLTDESKSGVLVSILKKILGDTSTDIDTSATEETSKIQKLILSYLNTKNVDITTEEGKSQIEKEALENINKATNTESEWSKIVYGSDNVVQVNMLNENWTVAKTKGDLASYASYIANNGVRQNIDTNKYGDYCLAFSYVHAYDLFNGTNGTASMAGNYAHAGAFTDFIDDNKNAVLSKVYTEILSGRPVILQVNGNKAGTSRHFVTVVGFRSSITDPTKLTEKDLLIIDSWDGKIERMDTNTSRFMTSGADCHKEYSGYRLRVLKTA